MEDDSRQDSDGRRRISTPEHWNSPEIALLLALLGLSLAVVPFRGLSWYSAAFLVCAITVVEVIMVTRLSPLLRSLTSRIASLPLLPLGVLVLVAAGVAVGWQLATSDAGAGVPPPGSVVNAQSGEVLPPQPPIQPDEMNPGSQIEGGDIFRICIPAAEPSCPYDLGEKAIYARRSDMIRFKLRLHEPAGASINFLKIVAGDSPTKQGMEVHVFLEWPTVKSADDTFTSIHAAAKLRIPAGGVHELEYVPGSSTLSDAVGDRLARLPDGIMDNYILLKNIGAPKGCWDCDLDYVRFVEFTARVR